MSGPNFSVMNISILNLSSVADRDFFTAIFFVEMILEEIFLGFMVFMVFDTNNLLIVS